MTNKDRADKIRELLNEINIHAEELFKDNYVVDVRKDGFLAPVFTDGIVFNPFPERNREPFARKYEVRIAKQIQEEI